MPVRSADVRAGSTSRSEPPTSGSTQSISTVRLRTRAVASGQESVVNVSGEPTRRLKLAPGRTDDDLGRALSGIGASSGPIRLIAVRFHPSDLDRAELELHLLSPSRDELYCVTTVFCDAVQTASYISPCERLSPDTSRFDLDAGQHELRAPSLHFYQRYLKCVLKWKAALTFQVD